MIFQKKPDAQNLEKKGDDYFIKKKYHEAAKAYDEALKLDPARLELYDKLITAHEKFADKWTEDDFAFNLELVMRKQEAENPAYRYINARPTPEFKASKALVTKLLKETDLENETKLISDILAHKEMAVYALLDAVMDFKHLATNLKKK